jgi:hypothetical protein
MRRLTGSRKPSLRSQGLGFFFRCAFKFGEMSNPPDKISLLHLATTWHSNDFWENYTRLATWRHVKTRFFLSTTTIDSHLRIIVDHFMF